MGTLLSILRAEIGEATFKSWFKNIQFGDFSRSKLTLLVPTRFMRDWIEKIIILTVFYQFFPKS